MLGRVNTFQFDGGRRIESRVATQDGVTPSNGNHLLRQTKRMVIMVVGSTLMLLGVALLVLPGPGVVVILLGLGVLAAEFAWARRVLLKVKRKAVAAKDWVQGRPQSQ